MALILKGSGSIADNNLSVNINDVTGIYSSTNLSGFGSPNLLVSAFVSSLVQIQKPDPTSFLPSGDVYPLTSLGFDTYPTLPNILNNAFNIPNSSLGLSPADPMPDGIYLANYSATTGGNVVYKSAFYFYNTKAIDCCYAKKAAKFCGCDDCDDNSEYMAYARFKLEYSCLKTYLCNGDNKNAARYFKILTDACAKCGCNE